MFESLFITLREGLEIALVVSVMASVLKQRGESHLFRLVLWGVIAGLGLSAVTAGALISLLAHTLSGEVVEGALFFVTAAFVAGMAVWVSRTAHRLKAAVAARLAVTTSSGWALVTMTGLLVWREGTEVVLMLRAASQAGGWAGQSVGVGAGILFAGLAGWQMVRGASKLPVASMLRVSTVVLWGLVGLFFLSGVHEWAESGVWRLPQAVWTWVIGPVALHGWAVLSAGALMMIAVEWFKAARAWAWPVAMTVAGCLVMAVSWAGDPPLSDGVQALTVSRGAITVPIRSVTSQASWFSYLKSDGSTGRLLAVRRPDGVVIAFDTCQNCLSEKGYRQEGEELICTHCGAESLPASLGKGLKSCMPAYLGGPYSAGSADPAWTLDALDRRYDEYLQAGGW